MFVHTCVCVYIIMIVCMYSVCMHMHVYVCVHMYVHTYLCVYVHACILFEVYMNTKDQKIKENIFCCFIGMLVSFITYLPLS